MADTRTEMRMTEAELEESIVSLFTDRPELCGFTVKLEPELSLVDVGVFPCTGSEDIQRLCEDIRAALLEVVEERPYARELLAGRTFARALH